MADNTSFNKKLDSAIGDLLPEDIDETDATSTDSLLDERTFGHTVDADRATDTARREIDDLAATLDLSEATVSTANSIFEQFTQKESLDGRIVELYSAACLYCSSKVNGDPVTPEEVSDAGDDLLTRKRLLRRAKAIASTLGLDPEAFFDATQYVSRYCDELDLDTGVEERALEVLDVCGAAGLASGKSPSGRAAAAIYNACLDTGRDVRQRDLSEVADVSTVTIRNRYQEQREHLRNVERPPDQPSETVSWIASQIGVSDATERAARAEIEAAVDTFGDEIRESMRSWAAAALRNASEGSDDPIGYKTLGQFTDADSSVIRRRKRDLKDGPDGGDGDSDSDGSPDPDSFPSDEDFAAAREQVVAAIRTADEKTRSAPRLVDVLTYTDVSKDLIVRTFGSFEAARRAADVGEQLD